MTDAQSLAHTKWECKDHVVWIAKYRKKKLFGEIRKELGPVLRELASHKECEILEDDGRPCPHVDRYSAEICGIANHRLSERQKRHPYRPELGWATEEHFWARGYYVSTVGLDEAAIRRYIQQQDDDDRRLDQLRLIE